VPLQRVEALPAFEQHRIVVAAPVALLHLADDLPLHLHHLRGRDLRASHGRLRLAELACLHPMLKFMPYVRVGDLAHAAVQRRFVDRSPVLHGFFLEQMIAGVADGLPRSLLRRPGWGLLLGEPACALLCLSHNPVGLVAVLPGQFSMLPLHLFRRQQLLAVAGAMGGDLPGRRAVDPLLPFVILHLLPSRTRRLQILPRVALDLRLAILAALDLVTQLLKTCGQLRAVDRRAVVLRGVQLVRLHRTGLPVLALGDVEDHSMRVELRRGIPRDRPRRVVLEGRGGELAGRLRGMDVADPRLGVVLDLAQGYANALPVRLPHPLIATDKRGQRNGFRRGERRIPPGAVLHAGDFPSLLALVGSGNLMPHKLLFGERVLAFAQSRKVVIADCALQAPLLGKPALPFAETLLVAAPIVLPLRCELPRVVRPRLACR